jgi:hypothetical protein
MWIKVYRIDPATGRKTVIKRKRDVGSGDPLSLRSVFPPCECPRCRRKLRS